MRSAPEINNPLLPSAIRVIIYDIVLFSPYTIQSVEDIKKSAAIMLGNRLGNLYFTCEIMAIIEICLGERKKSNGYSEENIFE